jgi:dTDP-4-amino-4,6-dideoxygalactose transaminase
VRAPARPRPYGAALFGAAEQGAVLEVLRRGILYRYHGRAVTTFEERFAGWLGEEVEALAVNSGSSALLLAYAACGLGPGDEVLVPTFGFVSAASAVHAVGAVPRFVGVEASGAIDVEAAAAAVNERTRAILAVHPLGAACDLEAVGALAARFDLRVIEDVAQACGGTYRGRRLGTYGDAAAFSFQHFKLIATGEGGMLVSGSGEVLDHAAFLHDSAAPWTMPERTARVGAVATAPGNLRMSELEGAIGLVQLGRCEGLLAGLRRRKRLALAAIEGCSTPALADPAGDAGSHLIVRVEADGAADRAAALREHGVAASPLLGPPGTNRHWAGDWGDLLDRCGIPGPSPETLAADRARLGDELVVQLEVGATAGEDAWLEGLIAGLAGV